ncbi:MAG: hypothetical protein FVQ79_10980 [Planctomycetes bacterium]|nr:hypothetical protein [Planctomycetota bacterium]
MKVISGCFIFMMVVFLAAWFAGCTEDSLQGITNEQTRLIASENIELNKQFAKKEKEIEAQKELLADCQKKNAKLEKKLKKASAGQCLEIKELLADCQKKNAKLEKRLKKTSADQGLEIMKMIEAMNKAKKKDLDKK